MRNIGNYIVVLGFVLALGAAGNVDCGGSLAEAIKYLILGAVLMVSGTAAMAK